jgi:hypothetical protein
MQASVLDGLAFDPCSFQQDGLTASEATGAFVQACAGLALRHPYRVEEPAEYPQGYREAGIPAPLGHRRIGSAVRGAASLRLRSACRSSRTCARGTLGRDGLTLMRAQKSALDRPAAEALCPTRSGSNRFIIFFLA